MYKKEYLPFIIKKEKTKKGTNYFLFGWRFLHITNKNSKELLKDANYLLKNYFSPQNFPTASGILRDIQLANIEILKEIDKVCSLSKMEYWLFFGSLLGSIRHKGYIPWDDDIDIGMNRNDYEKFINVFNKHSTEFIAEYCFSQQWNIIKVKHKSIPNLFVDIFPFDLFYKQVPLLSEKINLSKKVHETRKKYLEKSKDLSLQQKISLLKDLTNFEILKTQKVERENKPAIFLGLDFEWKQSTVFFDYEDIYPLTKTEFEGHLFPIPNQSDFILTYLYRDYMLLPKKLESKHLEISNLSLEEIIQIKKFIKERKSKHA